MGHLPETQAAESEVPIEGAAASAVAAAVAEPGRELQLFTHLGNCCYSSHKISLGRFGAGGLLRRLLSSRLLVTQFKRNTEER